MPDTSTQFQELCSQLSGMRLPKWEELPDLEIYMDQLLSLVSRYLSGYVQPEEKGLTSSMVNNYVKMGLLPPPVNKRYQREHLSRLIMICILKCALPISSIRRLLNTGISEHEAPQEFYNEFTDLFSRINRETCLSCTEPDGEAHTLSRAILQSSLRAQSEQVLAERLLRLQEPAEAIPLK